MNAQYLVYVNGKARVKVWAFDEQDAIRKTFEGPTPEGVSAFAVILKMGSDEQQCFGVSTY